MAGKMPGPPPGAQARQQGNDSGQQFSGERLTKFTKSILLAQAAVSMVVSLFFIIYAFNDEDSVSHRLFTWLEGDLAAALVIALFVVTLILVQHIEVLVKDQRR